MSKPEETRTATAVAGQAPAKSWVLATWRGGTADKDLPREGTLTIGRGTECDFVVPHRSVSRRHAKLHVGAELCIEDLGSANGTTVGERNLAPGVLTPVRGQAVQLGDVTLLVRGHVPALPVEEDEGEFLAEDPRMTSVLEWVDRLAPTDVAVLIGGEPGTGKTRVGAQLHRRSRRAAAPLVRVSCGALGHPGGERELVGSDDTPGLLEQADGASMLLRGIGELAPALGRRVLRAIDTRDVVRLGSGPARPCDVRFITTGALDLVEGAKSAPRADLLYRLRVACVTVPPLRERPGDVLPLARAFVSHLRRAAGRGPVSLGAPVERLLTGYHWPGNVRELRTVVETAALLCTGEVLAAGDVQQALVPAGPSRELAGELADLERARITQALETCGGNQTRAAELLGMPRRTLVARLTQYGLPRPLKGRR